MTGKKVLVVDEEPLLVESLTMALQDEGFVVVVAGDGEAALETFRAERPDVVILDLMLPKMHGLDVCRHLRAESEVPILMLTAKSQEADRVVGLELGADDYVTKPFSLRELIARVRAALRRPHLDQAGGLTGLGPGPAGKRLRSGPIEVDLDRREVWVSGQLIDLPRKEYDLLRVLLTHRGRTVTRENLLDWVWGDEFMGDFKTLDVHVRRLREKIEADPGNPQHILTVRGVGYKWGGP
jgi:DNA-binding response OmpR family regulator